MSMLDGVSQCWWLSKTCAVDWTAWGTLGGWTAAAATFLAVLLPYYRERRRARLRSKLTLGAYAQSLDRFARRLDMMSSARASLAGGDYYMPKKEVELVFALELDFPILEIEPELEDVILATNRLRSELETWRRATHVYAFGPEDPVPPRQISNLAPLLDALTSRLHERLEAVQSAIGDAVPALRDSSRRGL